MTDTKTRDIARMLMRTHGLRAHAVAEEHAGQARAKGDASSADHWNRVAVRVRALRASGAQAASSAASATTPSTMR